MLFRFSLYGFLKNQVYFEPFLMLALREKGLSFFQIGLLIGFMELVVNALEIPTGAIADIWGRRRSMILSFAAYIASFVLLGAAVSLPFLFTAMFLFGVGEAFRTGTHKAMIFTWLRMENRIGERTRVYGYTRSWSQFGSAFATLVAAAIVLVTGRFEMLFYVATIPYALGILNFLGYPRALDRDVETPASSGLVVRHLWETLTDAFRKPGLRRLMAESMAVEGVFHAVKDYLQPVLRTAAIMSLAAVAVTRNLNDAQQAALLIGPLYFVLFLLSGASSRLSHRLSDAVGGEERAAAYLQVALTTLYLMTGAGAFYDGTMIVVAGFVAIHALQNLWRPVLISRFDAHGTAARGATLLSIESQARRVSTMLLAPLVGLSVDWARENHIGGDFWTVGAIGAAASLLLLITGRRKPGRLGDAGLEPATSRV